MKGSVEILTFFQLSPPFALMGIILSYTVQYTVRC